LLRYSWMIFLFMGRHSWVVCKLIQGSHEVCGGRSSAKLGKLPLHGKARHNTRICYIWQRDWSGQS
jgi:hypothetical protein